jgi:hypothetical protein
MIEATNYKKCLICKGGKKNDCLMWHEDSDTGEIWVWCQGKCQRGYSIYEYCHIAGVELKEFLALDLKFQEAKAYEVNRMEWPRSFVPLFHKEAEEGIEYLASRGLKPTDNLFYDTSRQGIVLPYHLESSFVGAQIRFLHEKVNEDGDAWKITTLPGTRLGYLFYNWNQSPLLSHVKYVVVTEGAFNALSLQQALNAHYGGFLKNPFKCIANSGSGLSDHKMDVLKDLIEKGYKVIAAPDTDEAGEKLLGKFSDNGAATHFALVEEENRDWNDVLKDDGNLLASYFARQIKPL